MRAMYRLLNEIKMPQTAYWLRIWIIGDRIQWCSIGAIATLLVIWLFQMKP